MAVHTETIYHLDICAGTGMLGLGIKCALADRLRTVCYVERESYAAANLVARMEDKTLDTAPVWDDVKAMCNSEFINFIQGFRPLIITAGYPCQPFSLAGNRLGEADERHLWPWIAQFIEQIKPECCFFENVSGHLSMGFDTVHADLQRMGYRVAAGLFTAAEVGASHKRERLFILANAESQSRTLRKPGSTGCERDQLSSWNTGGNVAHTEPQRSGWRDSGIQSDQKRHLQTTGSSASLANTCEPGSQGCERNGSSGEWDGSETFGSTAEFCLPLFAPGPAELDRWRELIQADPGIEPAICRTADGMAKGLDKDRLRLTGNGVVPLAAAYAFVSLWAALEISERVNQ